MGGEEPRGDGLGGELLELRGGTGSRWPSALGTVCVARAWPLECAGEFEVADDGAEVRGLFTGDLDAADSGVFFAPGRKRMPSTSTSSAAGESFGTGFLTGRACGGIIVLVAGCLRGDVVTSSISMSSSEFVIISADFIFGFGAPCFAVADFPSLVPLEGFLGGLPIGPFGFTVAGAFFLPFPLMIRDIGSDLAAFGADLGASVVGFFVSVNVISGDRPLSLAALTLDLALIGLTDSEACSGETSALSRSSGDNNRRHSAACLPSRNF